MAGTTGEPNHPTDPFGPSPLQDLMYGHIHGAALRAVAVHRIADHLGDGPRTADDLAARTGTHAPSLRRILRLLAVRGLFHEDDRGAFRLDDSAQALRTDAPGSQLAAVLMITDPMFGRSTDGLAETLRTGEPAFELAYGTSFFEHLLKAPEDRATFDAGMASMSGPVEELVAQSYTFPEGARVIDVGGGRGGLLDAVLTREPTLTGVLFDQPATVAEHLLDRPGLAGRWHTEGGDFFSAVPPGGDFYVLKHILHDWSDEDALRILGTIRRAAAPGSRLLVVDAVLPEGSAPHPAVNVDVVMLLAVRGRERTAAEFSDLLGRAGFRLERILPTPTLPSVLEAVAV
ncbi:methyltransferase [Streptomyces sp. NPDC090022]|uniref:methyltransferase n=1 Tax=Streptomyces sp. NPDC090022 TaxID=3365920 RepID=UPI00381DAD1F